MRPLLLLIRAVLDILKLKNKKPERERETAYLELVLDGLPARGSERPTNYKGQQAKQGLMGL